MTEEERAELYRSQLHARRQARCERFAALAGDREAREALDLAWQSPLLARIESQGGVVDYPDADEDVICPVPDSARYVSTVPTELLL